MISCKPLRGGGEKLLTKRINEENTYDNRELKHLRNENPYMLITDDINKKSK